MIALYRMTYSGTKRRLVKYFNDLRECGEYLEFGDRSPNNKYFTNDRGDIYYYGKNKIWEIKINEE